MERNKLEKIKLNELEMKCFFGGEAVGTNKTTTSKEVNNCTDTDTVTDNADGSVTRCESWTCPD